MPFVLQAQVSKITNFPTEIKLKNSIDGKVGVAGNYYFFTATTAAEGEELWLTDGTETGTKMVKDIRPGTASAEYANFTEHKGKLYFFANNGANGFELWTSDGTTDGTKMVKDINPAGGIISSTAFSELISDGQYLYFGAITPGFGNEIWVSDGTATGTKMLKEIAVGSASSNPGDFFRFNNKVYFFAKSDVFKGAELWETSGTASSTQMVKLLDEQGATNLCTNVATNAQGFYFTMQLGFGDQLWKSDGTPENTKFVKNLNESTNALVLLENNKAIFTLNGGTNEDDIWVSDGTDIGTTVLKDLNYFIKRTPYSVIKWQEHAYVLANDVDDLLLVKTDGTVENTTTIGTFTTSTSGGSQYLRPFSKEFLIVAYKDYETHTEIFTSKGTLETTKLLVDLNPVEAKSSLPTDFMELRTSDIIFKAEQMTGDRQLFIYNRFEPLSGNIVISQTIKCHGDSTGILKANFTGGIGKYNYQWSNGSTTATVTNLPKGSYTVTVTDEDGIKKSASINLSQPDSIKITGIVKPESGGVANGKITLGVNGGTAPFKYNWSNGSTTKSPANLAAGTYAVTVTDANNCSKTASFEVLVASSTNETQDCYPTSQQSGKELFLTSCFSEGQFSMTDLSGKFITRQSFQNSNCRLDIANLSTGIYILSFENKEQNENQILKIFIQ